MKNNHSAIYSATCELEIDLRRIQSNYAQLKSRIKDGSKVSAVVKADGYGLGAVMVSKALQAVGCDEFFVAKFEEGVVLTTELDARFLDARFLDAQSLESSDQQPYKQLDQQSGQISDLISSNITTNKKTSIYVLDGVFEDNAEEFYNLKLIPVLNNLYQIKIWQNLAVLKGKNLPCVINVDIGMHRMGLQQKDFLELINNRDLLNKLNVKCLMSHMTSSEESNSCHNSRQLEKFRIYLSKFESVFGAVKASLSNSAGLFLGENYHFDLIRPGAALYGLCLNSQMLNLINPVKLTAPIIHLQELKKADTIGYNNSYVTVKDSLIATIPLGYADGISRSFSNVGKVCLGKVKLPIVGRVSMDYITVDVTSIPKEQIYLGQRIEILGDNMSLGELASYGNSFDYEILVNLSRRYKRKYKDVSTY